MRIAIRLALVLRQRRSEVLGIAKVELDLSQRLWKISAERMKGRRTHIVPLSSRAVDLIEEAISETEVAALKDGSRRRLEIWWINLGHLGARLPHTR